MIAFALNVNGKAVPFGNDDGVYRLSDLEAASIHSKAIRLLRNIVYPAGALSAIMLLAHGYYDAYLLEHTPALAAWLKGTFKLTSIPLAGTVAMILVDRNLEGSRPRALSDILAHLGTEASPAESATALRDLEYLVSRVTTKSPCLPALEPSTDLN